MKMRFVSTDVPRDRIKVYRADNYSLSQILFKEGESMTSEYIGGGVAADITSRHIQPVGTRISDDGALATMGPGSMTQYETYEIPEGVHRRVATEDTELWCLRDATDETKSVNEVNSIRLLPGEAIELLEGDRAFLIHGSVTVLDKTLQGPRLMIARGLRMLSAAGGVAYLFRWPDPTSV